MITAVESFVLNAQKNFVDRYLRLSELSKNNLFSNPKRPF